MISEATNKDYFTLGRNYNQIIRDGSFATRKEYLENQLFNHHIVEHNIQIQANIRKLHAAYIHEKIPDFYAYFFMGQILNCSEDRIADSINREMQLLRTKQCHYNFIMRTLNARQSCLKSLHRCLESIFEETNPSLFAKFKAEITHYRQLTALVVEQIKQWKQYLLQINSNVYGDEHIAFFFQSNDYLLKILNDVDFISQSFLSSKVTFSHKQDPFLLRPYTQSQASDNPYLQLFKFQTDERQRYVECLQFIADERADYLKRKITVKQQRIKQIQRAYQTKSMSSKILITKPQGALQKKPKQILLEAPIDFVEDVKNNIVVKESKRSNSLSEAKESKIKDILFRGQKIRKIKEMKIGEPPALINPKMFASIEPAEQKPFAPISRSISLSSLKKTSPLKKQKSEKQDKNNDFQSMLREKQLQVLDSDSIKRRTFSSIRLHDKLSERRQVLGLEGAQQLQKILDQLEHVAPQQEQGFIKKRAVSSRQGKSLLQHNEEAMLNLRKSILKEIEDHQSQKERVQQQKRDEREQMQRIIKEKLDKETLLDISKEKAKWAEGKDILAHEMGKKELFGYSDPVTHKSQKLTQLQEELKKQMQLKWLREVHQELSHRQALSKMDKQKKLQEEKREKQLQLVKRKEEQEKRFAQIEQEERLKVVESQLKRQQEKKREIQLEMEHIVAKEKEKLQSFSREQKIKLETQLKETMKASLLTKLRKEKSLFTQEIKAKEAQRLAEEAHRAEARWKIEAEFEIEKQLERQRQRQQKNRKVRLVAQKMEHLTHQLEKQQLQKESSLQNSRQLSELKKSITFIPDPRIEQKKPMREQNKKKLREQFQLQLFSFNREGNLLHDNFIIKDYKTKIDNQNNLNARMAQIQQEIRHDQEQIRKQQDMHKQQEPIQGKYAQQIEVVNIPEKPSSIKGVRERQLSSTSEQFIRFSEANSENKSEKRQPTITESDLKKIGIDMSPIQYMMYIKKKATIDTKKIKPNREEQELKKTRKILDQFEIMEELSQKINKKHEKAEFVIQDISEEDGTSQKMNKKVEKSQKLTHKQLNRRETPIKNSLDQPQKKQKQSELKDSEDLSQIMKLTVHSKMSPKKKKRFVTSEDSEESDFPKKSIKKQKAIQKEQYQKQQHKQQQEKSKHPKRVDVHQAAKFITLTQQNLDVYLIAHFKRLPKLMRKLNLFKKDELVKMIIETKSMLMIEVRKGDQSQGLCFITQNQNKQAIRSLNMLHFGPYSPENTIDLILKARQLLFSEDPCAEITFSMYYEKEDEEQYKFIKDFQRRFDPYGAIFQKKINNEQTERKHVMRRMIGEESRSPLVEKSSGLIKVTEHLFTHSVNQSLGLDLNLLDLDYSLGGWTLLSLFLSRYGDQEQISNFLAADVKQQNKNVKYLSKMASKLQGNTVKDIDYIEFDNPFEVNLKLIEQKQDILKCDPRVQQHQIPLKRMRLSLAIQLTLPFCATMTQILYTQSLYMLKYLRFKNGKGSKVMKLKSSLYSTQMIVIPCKPSNYKLFVLQAAELDTLPNLILDLYLKLFLANVDKHTLSADQHIWIPQFQSHQIKQIKIGRQFGFKNEIRSKSSMTYTQYINNCIQYHPSHKDILVTPPFIVGVLNSEVERLTESSPIFIERIDIDKLVGKKIIEKPPPQSDF